MDCFEILRKEFYTFKQVDIRNPEVARNIVTNQVIVEIEEWTTSNNAGMELTNDDFYEQFDYMLKTVKCNEYFKM